MSYSFVLVWVCLFPVLHADVAASFPLKEMIQFHKDTQALQGYSIASMMGVKACKNTYWLILENSKCMRDPLDMYLFRNIITCYALG